MRASTSVNYDESADYGATCCKRIYYYELKVTVSVMSYNKYPKKSTRNKQVYN